MSKLNNRKLYYCVSKLACFRFILSRFEPIDSPFVFETSFLFILYLSDTSTSVIIIGFLDWRTTDSVAKNSDNDGSRNIW